MAFLVWKLIWWSFWAAIPWGGRGVGDEDGGVQQFSGVVLVTPPVRGRRLPPAGLGSTYAPSQLHYILVSH